MPLTRKTTPITSSQTLPKPAQAALQAKTEALGVVQTLQTEVASLEVTSEEEYQLADQFLGRIRLKRSWWKDKMEAIIRPVRQGLDATYALNREVDKPLELLETTVKRTMADYKTQERLQLQAREEERLAEAERLRQEAEKLQAKAQTLISPVAKARALATAAIAVEQATEIEEAEPERGVLAVNSSARPVKKWRVVDLQMFLAAVGNGILPAEVVILNQVYLNKEFKLDPEGFGAWPGIETYDDTQIAGR